MRQFKLTNGNGATFDLMRKDAFLWNPSGLGWGYETDVVDVGEALIPTDTAYTHPAPSGVMIFRNYAVYNEFLRFVQVGGLTLGYMPLKTWRYLDVSIVMGKTEISKETNRLACEVTFAGLSFWYESLKSYRAGETITSTNAKRYTYQYGTNPASEVNYYIYPTTAGRAEISNGSLPSFLKITILGPAVNPAWALYDSSDNRIADGKVNRTINAGRKLVINSRPSETEIAEYTTAGDRIGSAYADSDFTTQRLFVLPPGDGYYMTFTDDGGAIGDCIIEVYERV